MLIIAAYIITAAIALAIIAAYLVLMVLLFGVLVGLTGIRDDIQNWRFIRLADLVRPVVLTAMFGVGFIGMASISVKLIRFIN